MQNEHTVLVTTIGTLECLCQLLVGWVLWHINPCRLLNAKSCLYKYILVNVEFVHNLFKQARAHLFAHKWFQVLLSNTKNLI